MLQRLSPNNHSSWKNTVNKRKLSLGKPIVQRLKNIPLNLRHFPPRDKMLPFPKVLLNPLNLSLIIETATYPMSPNLEEVKAECGELPHPGFKASSDAEALEMEPAVRWSIPISPRILETGIKPKLKAPPLQMKVALSQAVKPTPPIFTTAKKAILENPTQDNIFTGNQVQITPVRGLVPRGKDRTFRMRSEWKRQPRRQHRKKGKCPLKVGSRCLCAPHRLNSVEKSAQNETSSRVLLMCLYANKLPEIMQLAHDKKLCAVAFTET